MQISETELESLLSQAFDEGLCGYQELKDNYIKNIIKLFCSKQKPVEKKDRINTSNFLNIFSNTNDVTVVYPTVATSTVSVNI